MNREAKQVRGKIRTRLIEIGAEKSKRFGAMVVMILHAGGAETMKRRWIVVEVQYRPTFVSTVLPAR